ncbi:hypothetical protein [Microvirga sp. KLBC 81]|uniref:hypothetical protein n=1 Tax=Microvirga sp. KLBC 81 TaxID=1862707 RepID=UPI00105831D0|nr:hypothetical protein [Microvirga sp. KLBC 81]
MDTTLEALWRTGKKPFELTLHADDLLPIKQLQEALSEIVGILKKIYSNQAMNYFDDWHEHDGYVTSSSPTTWEELERIISSEEILYAERNGDTYVNSAYYPASCDFLLRFEILDEDDDKNYPGKWGEFDITSSPAIIKLIQSHLTAPAVEKLTTSLATDYFQKRYAG